MNLLQDGMSIIAVDSMSLASYMYIAFDFAFDFQQSLRSFFMSSISGDLMYHSAIVENLAREKRKKGLDIQPVNYIPRDVSISVIS